MSILLSGLVWVYVLLMCVGMWICGEFNPSPDDILFYRKSIADLTLPAQTVVEYDIISNVHRGEIKVFVRPFL